MTWIHSLWSHGASQRVGAKSTSRRKSGQRGPGPIKRGFNLERLEGRNLLSAGTIDPTFGTSGVATADFDTVPSASAELVQPDQKIVVVGTTHLVHHITDWTVRYYDQHFALARYNGDGSLDSSFGSGGKVTSQPSTLPSSAYAAALQPDGKIVVAG